ncbi:MAG: PSD1 and planctomycete cytochrome C domain-containing protein [Planctomycetaceae bacterium]
MSILGLLCLLLCGGAVLADEQSSGEKRSTQLSNQQHAPGEAFKSEIMPLLKRHCIKCHGVSKKEAGLQLHSAVRIFQGGESGAVVIPGHPETSSLLTRVQKNEMPPENQLSDSEKQVLERWIAGGALGLPANEAEADSMRRDEHWAFTRLQPSEPPLVRPSEICRTPVDQFIQFELEKVGLRISPAADRRTLIRRVSFILTGLPPTPDEIDRFLADESADAWNTMVERYLSSEQYGVRWGRHWLDAAGYADSNGYFNADSDRPLAWRYRDYVVRSINADKPFDQFVREQIAGDELSGFDPEKHRKAATPEMIDQLIATHYLRNGQDGTGESDGNPDEVRIDRYTALESSQQIIASSLLGLTFQCAKCHDHKFEPLTQKDFYQFQSVLFPAFNHEKWVKPNERVIYANPPGVYDAWEKQITDAKTRLTALQDDLREWSMRNRLPELVRFSDDFSVVDRLNENWSSTITGDDGPAGVSTVNLLNAAPANLNDQPLPAALSSNGLLQIIEGGATGDKWLATKQTFDWTPEVEGQWIQVTFSLIDTKVRDDEKSAERIAYGIALHDFNNNSDVVGGNILIDGNPAGGAAVHVDYPGPSSTHAGNIGSVGYVAGKSYGVRITHGAKRRFQLQHLVDGLPEGKSVELAEADLPDGCFAFGLCCHRSYQVDNVLVEASFAVDSQSPNAPAVAEFQAELKKRQDEIKAVADEIPELQAQEPGRIAWQTDTEPMPPDVFLLDRGEYSHPKDKVEPAPVSALNDDTNPLEITAPSGGFPSSGRRLAWANWVTKPGSRAASLMARVQVNRVWQQYFGAGLVSTPENLGMSGAEPTHPALLDWLAQEYIRSGWSLKTLHRVILCSAVFQQSSIANNEGTSADPYNKLLWRFPIRRLDAEAVRDSQLAISGDLDLSLEGPYVPTTRNGAAEVLVPESNPGAFRRSIYLQQRRSQGLSLLNVFDAPMMVVNCTRRPVTTMPLQSLTLLNSEFAVRRGHNFAKRILNDTEKSDEDRIRLAFVLATGAPCENNVALETLAFIQQQQELYAGMPDNRHKAWSDFCQLLLASNGCLYLE